MLKLYNKSKDPIEYLELWQNEQSIVIHSGKLGQDGEIETRKPEDAKTIDQLIEEEKQHAIQNNYQEIPLEDHVHLIIQYKKDKLLKKHNDLEKFQNDLGNIIDEALEWTGNGHCDASDLGANTVNIFNFVVDPYIAKQTILEVLKAENLLEAMTMAIEQDDNYKILWPENHNGEFKIY